MVFGVVSSAQEAAMLREHLGNDFIYVTPGIRLPEDQADDQKRIMTPGRAMAAGSTYLVIGRAITQAAAPIEVLKKIYDSLT